MAQGQEPRGHACARSERVPKLVPVLPQGYLRCREKPGRFAPAHTTRPSGPFPSRLAPTRAEAIQERQSRLANSAATHAIEWDRGK